MLTSYGVTRRHEVRRAWTIAAISGRCFDQERCPALQSDSLTHRLQTALLVLLAGAAGARVVATDLRAVASHGFDRLMMVVAVVAVRTVHVAVIMIMVAIGPMYVPLDLHVIVRRFRILRHLRVPAACFC
jgi:hypothetical protein